MTPAWGCPWHGKVQSGQLTLSNGQSLEWPQPDGTGVAENPNNPELWHPENAGYTWLQRMPGLSAVQRTADELAADQAAGRQWLHQAIVAGGRDAHLHGTRIGGWIYGAPDGSRWLAQFAGLLSWTSSGGLSLAGHLVRFGVLGGAAQRTYIERSLSNAMLGQSEWIDESRYAQVEDISPDGGRAIIALYRADTVGGLVQELPIGFALLEITGSPGVDLVVALSVLRTADQTVQAAVVDNSASIQRFTLQQTVARSVDSSGVSPSPECSGTYAITETYSIAYVAHPAGSPYYTGTNSTEQRRIVALAFDGNGVIHEAVLTSRLSSTANEAPPSVMVSGVDRGYAYSEAVGGSCEIRYPIVYQTRTSIGYAINSTRIDVSEAVLEFAGRSITARATKTRAVESSWTDVVGSGTASAQTTNTSAFTAEIDGQAASSRSQTSSSSQKFDGTLGIDIYGQGEVALPYVSWGYDNTGEGFVVNIKRWSNKLIGLRIKHRSGDACGIHWSDGLHPGGTAAGGYEATDAAFNSAKIFGSLNPITGEAVIMSDTPISWT